MNKKISMPAIAIVVLLATTAFMLVPVRSVPAEKRTFTAKYSADIIDPGEGWITGGNIQQVKGSTSVGYVTGDIEGEGIFIQRYSLDLDTGEGQAHGEWMMTTDGGEIRGTWRGKTTSWTLLWGTLVGTHGTGDYEGVQFRASYTGKVYTEDSHPRYEIDISGIMLVPRP